MSGRVRWPRRSCRRLGSAYSRDSTVSSPARRSRRGSSRSSRTSRLRAGCVRAAVSFSSVAQREADAFDEPVDSSRFFPADHDRWPGHWALAPTRWETPEGALLAGETRNCILRAVDELPPAQRTIITLRDIEGWPPQEVCDVLGVSDGNQRVLLHRARSKVRSAFEQYFGAVGVTVA